MSWQEALVIVACIAGFVTALRTVLPYLRTRSDEQRRADALKAVNDRLERVESELAGRKMPGGTFGRRTA